MADFLVIGAGIGGLATAQALLRLGHGVRVYEAAAELREIGAGVVLGVMALGVMAQNRWGGAGGGGPRYVAARDADRHRIGTANVRAGKRGGNGGSFEGKLPKNCLPLWEPSMAG